MGWADWASSRGLKAIALPQRTDDETTAEVY